ncbi:DUF4259 domain-containing protein [Sandaracinus amylolyticus]|uniref:DUF4259 domain-containing protein n=1 Tax=Sandaracinus amylolyticus TaxID=927083 RepID=A0A0F6SG57_9BACT|nr:DUF4259 domain-containing protein [Sandaracinus amylolyticus]AKF08114.1 hypothetical protein DB32_005263 [Sandaracinus amylolyticus]
MGAWGHGAFENDDSLDWLAELEAGRMTVRDALEAAVAESDDLLEAPEASMAIAAATLVAAAKDGERTALPDGARAWVDANGAAAKADVALAIRAVERVLDAAGSELAELWADAETDEWRGDVEALLARLRR